jgi:cation diffusion facilitator family transporter
MASGNTKQIITSLVVNMLIAVSKGVAAAITGSGALLAETIHSLADCGNQGLLLFGVKQARKPPDESHPLGYGRALYFWSFMVALLLFTGGGVFSIYEGIHKTIHPEPVGSVTVGVIILAIALALEGYSTFGNVVEFNKKRGKTKFFRYLQLTKDSDLVVVFGENSAAVLGLIFALIALVMSKLTNNGRWDGVGSLMIGLVLVGVAIFLAIEVKSLIVGESADPALDHDIRAVAAKHSSINQVLRILTVQQGPGEVMVAMKVKFKPGLTTGGSLCEAINKFEQDLQDTIPDIRWSFIEPDMID